MEVEDQIITFQTYYDPMLAHIVRTRLEDSGVSCFIADENMIGINPLYNNALGGIKLKIFARDEGKCREILAQDDTLTVEEYVEIDEATNQVVICPYCASTNVRFGNATEKRFGIFSFVFSVLLFVYPPFARKAWHCFNCGKDFE